MNPRQGRFAKVLPAIVLFMVYISLLIAFKGMIEKGNQKIILGLGGLHLIYLVIGMTLVSGASLKRLLRPKAATRKAV